MAQIHIVRPHQSDLEGARKAAQKAAEQMAERYEIEYRWEGDDIHFSRAGVDGVMHVTDEQIEIEASLGFFLAMLKQPIENEIRQQLDQFFS